MQVYLFEKSKRKIRSLKYQVSFYCVEGLVDKVLWDDTKEQEHLNLD